MSKDKTRGSISTSAGRSTGLSNTHVTPCPGQGFPLYFASAFDAALDLIPKREKHISLESVDVGAM
jgi:hypothetical protein